MIFHADVNTGCRYCQGNGCLHCASRHLGRVTGEVRVGLLSAEQLERVIDCLATRPGLNLHLTIVVPGMEPAKQVWSEFAEGKEAQWLGSIDGSIWGQPGQVPVPSARNAGRRRVQDLLDRAERANPEGLELRHARQMLSQWLAHDTAYAAEQVRAWRAEVGRLEAEQVQSVSVPGDGAPDPGAMPRRVVLQRAKGWRMPPNTIKVDRSTRWGNPFRIGSMVTGVPGFCKGACEERVIVTAEEAVLCYEAWLSGAVTLWEQRPPSLRDMAKALRGRNLACWCKEGDACHAEVLLRWANGREAGEYAA